MAHAKQEKKIDFKEFLRKADIKVTDGRLAVLLLLEKALSPITIEEIEKKIKAKGLNQSTIYRMLKTFTEKGIVKEIYISSGKAHFELNRHDDHHHVVCTNCGLIDELPDCTLSDIEKKTLKEAKHFSKISAHSLEFFGICKTCSRK